MGRPLKIAKAQLITLTATNGTTEVATTSANLNALGIVAGSPFIPASTAGGLTGGTTYWILEVLSATTFTVSTTPPSQNVSGTRANLSPAGPISVVLTVYPVDTGFNIPAGPTNTYGVVGGNTGIYGQQIQARVAIAVDGAGSIYASTGSAVVSGMGTDFGTDIAIGDVITTSDGTTVGFVSSVGGAISMTTVGSSSVTDAIEVNDTTGLVAEGAVVFGAAIGGLSAGTIYYVENVVDGTHFTVSLTPAGVLQPLTTTTVVTTATQDTVTLAANAALNVTNGAYIYATSEDGYIVRQKGKTKYLVVGTTTARTGACYTANLADAALTPGTMSITATAPGPTTVRLSTVNDYYGVDFTAVAGNPGVKYIASFNGSGTTTTTPVALTAAPGDIVYTIVDVESA